MKLKQRCRYRNSIIYERDPSIHPPLDDIDLSLSKSLSFVHKVGFPPRIQSLLQQTCRNHVNLAPLTNSDGRGKRFGTERVSAKGALGASFAEPAFNVDGGR